MDDKRIVEVLNLGKYFGHIRAVDDISFQVGKGEVLGFLGPNGAGKSTTMKMLTCFISPDFGTAKVDGHDIIRQPGMVRSVLGYLPENAPAYEDMTVEDFLSFIADIRKLKGEQKQKQLDKVYELVALKDVRKQTIGTLSKGFKRRVMFAQAIIHDPLVLILDEPTDGLDPNQKYEVRQLIRQMAKDKVIILSTHILEEVDEVCTRAIIIAKGKLLADGSPVDLKKQSKSYASVKLILNKNDAEKAMTHLNSFSEIETIEKETVTSDFMKIKIFPKEKKNLVNKVIKICSDNSLTIHDISLNEGNLPEVFREITTNK